MQRIKIGHKSTAQKYSKLICVIYLSVFYVHILSKIRIILYRIFYKLFSRIKIVWTFSHVMKYFAMPCVITATVWHSVLKFFRICFFRDEKPYTHSKVEWKGHFETGKLNPLRKKQSKNHPEDFPGGAVLKNPPANAGDTGSSPGLGRSHMPRSN